MTDISKILKEGEKPIEPTEKPVEIIKPSPDSEKKITSLETEVSDLKFDGAFKDITQTYPLAAEYKDKIKEKVKAGYSVADATVAVLAPEKKLLTADEIRARDNKGNGLGGSASPQLDLEKKPAKTVSELETEFKDAEARGEIRLS